MLSSPAKQLPTAGRPPLGLVLETPSTRMVLAASAAQMLRALTLSAPRPPRPSPCCDLQVTPLLSVSAFLFCIARRFPSAVPLSKNKAPCQVSQNKTISTPVGYTLLSCLFGLSNGRSVTLVLSFKGVRGHIKKEEIQ